MIQPESGSWPPLTGLRDHTDIPYSVGLLWTSVQPVAETYTLATHNIDRIQTSMPPVEFEPATPSKRAAAGPRP